MPNFGFEISQKKRKNEITIIAVGADRIISLRSRVNEKAQSNVEDTKSESIDNFPTDATRASDWNQLIRNARERSLQNYLSESRNDAFCPALA